MKQDRQTRMLEVRNLVRGLKLSVIMTTVCVNSSAYDTYYDKRTTIGTITSGTCSRMNAGTM